MLKYRFLLNGTEIHPHWANDTALEEKKASGTQYYRKTISGKFILIGSEYYLVQAAKAETLFRVVVQELISGAYISKSTVFFYKTDCEINEDDKTVTLNAKDNDEYSYILASLDKEVNLVACNPKITSSYIWRRPLLQLYSPNDTVIFNYVGNTYWEAEVANPASETQLVDDYHFKKLFDGILYNIYKVSGSSNEEINQYFIADIPYNQQPDSNTVFYSSDGKYKLIYTDWLEDGITHVGQLIIRISDNAWIARRRRTGNMWKDTFPMETLVPSTGYDITVEREAHWVYGRYLINSPKFYTLWATNVDTIEIPDDDICADNNNYEYCIPIHESIVPYVQIIFSEKHTPVPNQYGLFNSDNNIYYKIPKAITKGDNVMPISRNMWGAYATWLEYNSYLTMVEQYNIEQKKIKDAYKFVDGLSALLTKVFTPTDIGYCNSLDTTGMLYINPGDGTIVNSGSLLFYTQFDFLPVSPDMEFCTKGLKYIAFYESDNESSFISGVSYYSNYDEEHILTTPAIALFFRYSIEAEYGIETAYFRRTTPYQIPIHDETCSHFLYDTPNPVTKSNLDTLFICPKTNILDSNYDQAY